MTELRVNRKKGREIPIFEVVDAKIIIKRTGNDKFKITTTGFNLDQDDFELPRGDEITIHGLTMFVRPEEE